MKDARPFFCYTRRMVGWWKRCLFLAVNCCWLVACALQPISPADLQPPTFVPQPEPMVTVSSEQLPVDGDQVEEMMAVATQSPVSELQSPTPAPTAVSPTATLPPPMPTPTPDLYAELTIDALTARDYGGGELDIIDTLEENETFTRYLITFPSDGLTVYGFMNVPSKGTNFPVVVMLHGYVPPSEYNTLAYTQRYADALAEAGYFVIHPNLRNYPPSDSGPNPFRVGYAIDVLNLIAIVREQSQDPFGYLRRADENSIHLWGHSMGGGVALRVITVNNEPYLRTAVLYGSMSGDERQNFEQIHVWSGGQNGPFELEADEARLAEISPINYLDRIKAAISIHHSEGDETVPVAWSNDLCARLEALSKPVECFTYYATPHTFRGDADALFMERVRRFFNEN